MIPDRRARASVISGLVTKSWVIAPLCLQVPVESVKIQARPVLFDSLFQAVSVLHVILVF
ncbi:hypothetical protein Bca52824_040523 [Brassica carinata]|uniref:Uncharacterized protein n=1 Tax=Brassica carinata TaxID=52824 RepID=A0A8X7RRE9_BRACI|nr:hypothetical protein Bca52824_040523 [Brassica carinata]